MNQKIITVNLSRILQKLVELNIHTPNASYEMILETMMRCANEPNVNGYDTFTNILLTYFPSDKDLSIKTFLNFAAFDFYGMVDNFNGLKTHYDIIKIDIIISNGNSNVCNAVINCRGKSYG